MDRGTTILNTLNDNYAMRFDGCEWLRDVGSTAYAVLSGRDRYFLRIVKPAFLDTAIVGAEVQVFLQGRGFPVPRIICTKEGRPYFRERTAKGLCEEGGLYILYEFVEGEDSDAEQDAEAVGALVGRLHLEMEDYPGELVERDKHFYVGRYVDILKGRKYPRVEEFATYGDDLWERMKGLPRGYCHGDMYVGNIRKTPAGKLYIHDFDTSCIGFPMYDVTLFCDRTEYFNYDVRNYGKSNKTLSRFLPEYEKFCPLSQAEIDVFHTMIAVQHFSTQATIMEIFGDDCLSDAELAEQLDWLYQWREQSEGPKGE